MFVGSGGKLSQIVSDGSGRAEGRKMLVRARKTRMTVVYLREKAL
jgi:hypothetical protein